MVVHYQTAIPVCLTNTNWHCIIFVTDPATPRGTTHDARSFAQPTFGEAFPDQALILATCQDMISFENRVSSVHERRATGLKFHAIKYELKEERVTASRNNPFTGVARRFVKVTVRVVPREH